MRGIGPTFFQKRSLTCHHFCFLRLMWLSKIFNTETFAENKRRDQTQSSKSDHLHVHAKKKGLSSRSPRIQGLFIHSDATNELKNLDLVILCLVMVLDEKRFQPWTWLFYKPVSRQDKIRQEVTSLLSTFFRRYCLIRMASFFFFFVSSFSSFAMRYCQYFSFLVSRINDMHLCLELGSRHWN